MGGKITTLMEALDTLIAAITTGVAPNTVSVFDHVWIGMPDKIPMGAKNVAIIEVASAPNFEYLMCGTTKYFYDLDILITLMSKGHVETAHKNLYDALNLLMTAIAANDNISAKCDSSTFENIEFGDVAEGKDGRNLIAGCRLTLRCKVS